MTEYRYIVFRQLIFLEFVTHTFIVPTTYIMFYRSTFASWNNSVIMANFSEIFHIYLISMAFIYIVSLLSVGRCCRCCSRSTDGSNTKVAEID